MESAHGPENSGRTKPKLSVPFDVPTEISGILIYGHGKRPRENPVTPGRIKMERFIPMETFRNKRNTFRVLPFSRLYRNDRHFLYYLSGWLVPGFLLRRKAISFWLALNPGPLVIWAKLFEGRLALN